MFNYNHIHVVRELAFRLRVVDSCIGLVNAKEEDGNKRPRLTRLALAASGQPVTRATALTYASHHRMDEAEQVICNNFIGRSLSALKGGIRLWRESTVSNDQQQTPAT